MTIDINNMTVLWGFTSKMWPFSKNTMTILENFAYSNSLSVAAANASIWGHNENNAIQITFYDDVINKSVYHVKNIYPLIMKKTDEFEQYPLYADSIEEYFIACSSCTTMFIEFSFGSMTAGRILKPVVNAENALIELDMHSAVC